MVENALNWLNISMLFRGQTLASVHLWHIFFQQEFLKILQKVRLAEFVVPNLISFGTSSVVLCCSIALQKLHFIHFFP